MSAKEVVVATAENEITSTVLESLVLYGDISALNKAQRVTYYTQLCERVGLDPATTPFLPIKLNNKEQLYAGKGCAEQLRKLHKVSIKITSRERMDDVYCVTALATMPDGRTDESIGAVFVGALKGESLANALMKAETKAKRRATLSIVGLGGMLDESEIDDLREDRFANLPPEQTAQVERAANVVNMPTSQKIEKARAAAATVEQPRRAERQGEGIPERWTPKSAIPASILLAIPQLGELSMPVEEMNLDQLELVVEQVAHAYERWKENPKTTEKTLTALNAIGAAASAVHYSKTNPVGAA